MDINLSRRQEKLIQVLLREEQIISSIEIGKLFQLSDRTIRNEIKTINSIFDKRYIISYKRLGFAIVEKAEMEAILKSVESSKGKRQILILKYILSHNEANYYDIVDEFFISETTLDKDLRTINRIIIQRFEKITITRRNNLLVLQGSEQARRQIYTYFLINEIDEYDFNFTKYVYYFKHCDILQLKEVVVQFVQEEKIKMRDISLISFILHLAIMIERVADGQAIHANIQSIMDEHEEKQRDTLCSRIEEMLGIQLPQSEWAYVSTLFSNKIIMKNEESKYNEASYHSFIQFAIDEIYKNYQIDLRQDTTFYHNVLMHLVALERRIDQNQFLKNPLVEDIKEHFPLIYDISVYLSLQIKEILNFDLREDEIGFIALHLMCAVEKIKSNKKKIVVISPNGSASISYLQQKLMNYFDTKIEIIESYSFFEIDKLREIELDLILSTVPLIDEFKAPIFQISNILSNDELESIDHYFKQKESRNEENMEEVKQLFHEELFFPNCEFHEKTEVIEFLCHQLYEHNYVDEEYVLSVMQREQIAPTAFGNLFAIPHPVKKIAKKNAIAILSLKEAIDWSNHKVKLVFLFSLSKESKNLTRLYEVLVTLLEDINRVKRISKIDSYEEFIIEIFK